MAAEAAHAKARAAQGALRRCQAEAAALNQARDTAEAELGAARADVARLRQRLEAAQVRADCGGPQAGFLSNACMPNPQETC